MAVDTLRDLFVKELSDVYNAEKQITKALPKMAKAASFPELQDAFSKHLKQTEGHIGGSTRCSTCSARSRSA